MLMRAALTWTSAVLLRPREPSRLASHFRVAYWPWATPPLQGSQVNSVTHTSPAPFRLSYISVPLHFDWHQDLISLPPALRHAHAQTDTHTLSLAFQPLFWISAIAAVRWNHPSRTPPTEPQEKTSVCQRVESARRRRLAPVAQFPKLPKGHSSTHVFLFLPSNVRQISRLLSLFTFFGARELKRDNGLLTAPVPCCFEPTLNAFWNLHVDRMLLHLMRSNRLGEKRKKPNVFFFKWRGLSARSSMDRRKSFHFFFFSILTNWIQTAAVRSIHRMPF